MNINLLSKLLLGVGVISCINAQSETLNDIDFIVDKKIQKINFLFEDKSVVPQYFENNNNKQLIFDFPKIVDFDLSDDVVPKLRDFLEITGVSIIKSANKNRIVVDLKDNKKLNIIKQLGKSIEFGLFDKLEYVKDIKKNIPVKRPIINNITFSANKNADGIFSIYLPKKHGVISTEIVGNDIVVTIQQAKIAKEWLHNMNVSSFDTPVKMVSGKNSAAHATFTLSGSQEIVFNEKETSDKYSIKISKKSSTVSVFDLQKKITLDLQDVDIRSALQILAKFAGANMVISNTVQGTITLNLKDVPWNQALNVILLSKSLAKREEGSVMYIGTSREIIASEQAKLASKQANDSILPLEVKFIKINYAKASEIASTLLANQGSDSTSILSRRGSIQVDPRTNTLIIKDTASGIKKVEKMIKQLDVPVKQVLIEARVVEVNKNISNDFGVGTFLEALGFTAGKNVIGSAASTFNPSGGATPAGGSTLALSFSRLFTNVNLTLELNALESEGKSKLLSSPHLLVSDNQQASIQSGKEVPYLESSPSGAASIAFKNANLSLTVTPHVSPNGTITMDVTISKNSVSKQNIGGQDGQPIIDTRSITTKLMTQSGETVVLGGIYETDKQRTVDQVPLLGDIPILGWLFKKETVLDVEKELLIFLTPTIVSDSGALEFENKDDF